MYDVIWVLALALNRTMTMIASRDICQTGCKDIPGTLAPLEYFNYSNEKIGCLVQWNLQQTTFNGVSVRALLLIVWMESELTIASMTRL